MKNIFLKSTNFLIISLFFIQLFIVPGISFAQTKCGVDADGKITYCALVPEALEAFGKSDGDLGSFLNQAFQFGLALAAALAVVMVVWGGVEYMLSESLFSKEGAREKIRNAIWGLILALVSWLILFTINPNLVIFKL